MDKAIKIGPNFSPGPLITHLKVHPREHGFYVAKHANKHASNITASTSQKNIQTFFPKASDIKVTFKRKFCQFVVNDSMSLKIGESAAFKAMIYAANKCIQVLSYETTIDILHNKRHQSSLELKKYLKGIYFPTTIDHWTSLANENYGAVTCHLIDDDFKPKAYVLSCMKHENGSSARAMEQQLTKDLRA